MVGKESNKGLASSPLCLFWLILKAMNMIVFKDEIFSVSREDLVHFNGPTLEAT